MDLFKHAVWRGPRDCHQTERGPGPGTGEPPWGAEDRSGDAGCVICACWGREGVDGTETSVWDGRLGNPEESNVGWYWKVASAAPTTTSGGGRFPPLASHVALAVGGCWAQWGEEQLLPNSSLGEAVGQGCS